MEKGPIGGGGSGEFVAFGSDSAENLEQLAMTSENLLGVGNELAGDLGPLAVTTENLLGGRNKLAGAIGRSAHGLVMEVAILGVE